MGRKSKRWEIISGADFERTVERRIQELEDQENEKKEKTERKTVGEGKDEAKTESDLYSSLNNA